MRPFAINRLALLVLILACGLLLAGRPARAALDGDEFTSRLDALVLQGNDLLAQAAAITLTPLNMASKTGELETAIGDYRASVMDLYNTVVAESGSSLSLTPEMLVALQTLSTVTLSLANTCADLTVQIGTLAATTFNSALESSLAAMLRLSDDIGLMADRILEMADKILVMADNIGEMADRIIATQVIQSNNLKLIVDAVLTTQTNIIKLISLFL